MNWHKWVQKHEETRREIAQDFVSTVDFENGQGMSSKSFYYHGGANPMPGIPEGKCLVVHYYFEDEE